MHKGTTKTTVESGHEKSGLRRINIAYPEPIAEHRRGNELVLRDLREQLVIRRLLKQHLVVNLDANIDKACSVLKFGTIILPTFLAAFSSLN